MRVLVADDNPVCTDVLQTAVAEQDWEVHPLSDGRQVIELLESDSFDVLLLDINLPGMDGFEVLQRARQLVPDIKVIVISGSIGVAETARAMKLGAFDCLSKPFNIEDLLGTLKTLAKNLAIKRQNSSSQSEMVAVSVPMREVHAKILSVARSRVSTVLLTGETGTGKEVVARRLHRNGENREKPFVAINCSAIPVSLVESELFGHEKGAFTDARLTRKGCFESAADGTIFLDEIAELSLELQSKLLRVLQERTFRRVGGTEEIPLRARVVTATNADLATLVRRGLFREDLYYRLAIIPIHLLPLRERTADIIPLAERFLGLFGREMRCETPALTDAHKQALLAHTWPGNVRELRNVMERFVVMNGVIEFVSTTRDLNAPSPAPAAENTAPITDTERKRIYALLLDKLLSEGTLEPARPSAHAKTPVPSACSLT